MFKEKRIICSQGKNAALVCVSKQCEGHLFVCSRSCLCCVLHTEKCSLKNIQEVSNGIESLLKRNFRKDLKGQTIQVVARVAKQTAPAPHNTPFCFTYCEADPSYNQNMEFRIKSLKGCIGVGAMHKTIIPNNYYHYKPDENYIHHGGYMLLSNGYQYSHSNCLENFIQYSSGLKLEEGRTIQIRTERNQLIFEQGFHKVVLSLPESVLSDLVYGVYLYQEGDQIQVLVKQ